MAGGAAVAWRTFLLGTRKPFPGLVVSRAGAFGFSLFPNDLGLFSVETSESLAEDQESHAKGKRVLPSGRDSQPAI